MNKTQESAIIQFIEENIQPFQLRRKDKLRNLNLHELLKTKNPYLFKAKAPQTIEELVKLMIDAYISSQEETVFGKFLEKLAIFVCHCVYKGQKSSTKGLDLEFDKEGIRYLVSIKSGPNWGNSEAISKMRDRFRKAKITLGGNGSIGTVCAVNGCCYGKDDNPNKGDYFKYCGQRFWEFISGDENLYTKIIEPLGHRAKERNEEFFVEYAKIINKFTLEFGREYCDPDDGSILWEKLVEFNSAKKSPIPQSTEQSSKRSSGRKRASA